MLLAVVGSLRVMQSAFYSLDAARGLNIATQILQSEMEKARMANWTVISALPTTGATELTLDPAFSSEAFVSGRFQLTRRVSDVRTGVRDLTFTITWRAYNGATASRTTRMRYTQNGLYDFFYSSN
jgi:hypothetical protein